MDGLEGVALEFTFCAHGRSPAVSPHRITDVQSLEGAASKAFPAWCRAHFLYHAYCGDVYP
jgi:hypothetical protein